MEIPSDDESADAENIQIINGRQRVVFNICHKYEIMLNICYQKENLKLIQFNYLYLALELQENFKWRKLLIRLSQKYCYIMQRIQKNFALYCYCQ